MTFWELNSVLSKHGRPSGLSRLSLQIVIGSGVSGSSPLLVFLGGVVLIALFSRPVSKPRVPHVEQVEEAGRRGELSLETSQTEQ